MSITIGPPDIDELRPRILVIGVGGAGGNAIANMIEAEIQGVDFIVANTDAQALNSSIAEQRIQLGPQITQGLGAGSRAEVGRAAAEETLEDIDRALEGVHMVFIAAGMGGGTGTGAAPIIAKAAREKGVLTVGVVTKPFLFEGTRRMRAAEAGIDELQEHVDTLIVIPNQNLFLVAKAETTFKEAFLLADEVLQQGVRSITDLMVMPGLINLDFADVRSVMGEMGKAMMGTGEGEGQNRALEAAERAIANPLLDGVSMQGARGVIISIIGGEDMKLLEVDEAANHIRELVDDDANIIWGSAFNPELDGKIRVSVVATGIDHQGSPAGEMAPARSLDLGRSRGPVTPATPQEPKNIEPLFGAGDGPDTDRAPEPEPVARVPEPMPDPALDDEGEGEEESGKPENLLARASDRPAASDDGDDSEDTLDLSEMDEVDEDGEEDEEDDTADSSSYASLTGVKSTAREPEPQPEPDTLDLGREAESAPDSAGAAAGAAAGASAASAAGSAGAPAGNPPSGGSTLFERMANLSRGTADKDDDDEDDENGDDDPGSISIPRFLGRQNNQ